MVGVAVAFALVVPTTSSTQMHAENLEEFDNFECPGSCQIGADVCCETHIPPFCVPGPCQE
jgi:hypothetical protein